MKHLLMTCLALLLFGCQKETTCDDPTSLTFNTNGDCEYVNTDQQALYFKFTATWCGPCGGSGAKKMREQLETYPQLIGIEAHYRDEMRSTISDAFIDYFNIRGTPSFKINDNDWIVVLNRNPVAGLRVEFDIDDNAMTVETDIQALEDMPEGEYTLAVYLLEDGHVSRQKASDHSAYPEWEYKNGYYPKFRFTNTLRQEATGNIFGTPILSGQMTTGERLFRKDIINFEKGYEGQLYPVAALWRKNGSRMTLINTVSGKN